MLLSVVMQMPDPTELFVYGTLRHDQPEHARYCRGVVGWQPARVFGRLFRIREGYRLLVLPPQAILVRASPAAGLDEQRRRALSPAELADAAARLLRTGGGWIRGELLRFADAAEAWPPLDAWEGTSTHGDSIYARIVVPVEQPDGSGLFVPAWVYGAVEPPAGAVEIEPAAAS